MANENKDGGPAFPTATPAIKKNYQPTGQVYSEDPIYPFQGMSLRDYFAAKALTGNLAADAEQKSSARQHADWAFEHADAMLATRSGERK